MNRSKIEKSLESLGYTVRYHVHSWTECLVSGHGEDWYGRGSDEPQALAQVTRQMFPSRGAEQLFEGTVPEPFAKEVKTLDEAYDPKPVVQKPKTPRVPKPIVVDERQPEVVILSPPSPEEFVIEEVEEVLPPMTREEAFEYLAEIEKEIVDEIEDVAMMSQTYQRLNLALWICRARTVESAFPDDPLIEDSVHQIALKITSMSKMFWPGTMRGLMKDMKPRETLGGLVPMSRTEPPSTWEEAVSLIETHMDEVYETGGEFGWQDDHLCLPYPVNAKATLDEAVRFIESTLGSVNETPPEKRDIFQSKDILCGVKDLEKGAMLLRWCRKKCRDPLLWGRSMGLLRWVVRDVLKHSAGKLKHLIDSNHTPSESWAELLGRDPTVNRRTVLQRKVLANPPQATWKEEDTMEWLCEAFEAFSNPQIAKLSKAVHEHIMSFENVDFSDADRSVRSRLRKLQSMIRCNADTSSVELPSEEELATPEEAEEVSEEADVEDPAETIAKRVRRHTKGKRLLFVTNRNDKRLQKELETNLQCEVSLKNINDLKAKMIADGITADKYNMMLLATSFMDHSSLGVLTRKAKSENVPVVRVSKGRLAATTRALDNAFNLEETSN